MFLHRIDPKSTSLPFHPAALHEWPERDIAAYAWFWVLLSIALLALILVGIRIWLYSRQQHEHGCPCRKCKPPAKKWIPIELKSIGRASLKQPTTLNGLPSIDEEVEVLVASSQEGSSEPRSSSSSPPPAPPPPGFKFNGDGVLVYGTQTGPVSRNSSRRNSLPSNLKNLYNQTKIGFEGLFHNKKETDQTASPTENPLSL